MNHLFLPIITCKTTAFNDPTNCGEIVGRFFSMGLHLAQWLRRIAFSWHMQMPINSIVVEISLCYSHYFTHSISKPETVQSKDRPHFRQDTKSDLFSCYVPFLLNTPHILGSHQRPAENRPTGISPLPGYL